MQNRWALELAKMSTEQSKRRWRFSVRSSICALTILAVIFALTGYQLRRLRAQEQAFVEISRRGGTILVYDEGVYIRFSAPRGICGTGLNRVIGASGSPSQFADKDTRHLYSVINLVSLDLSNTSVTDDAIGQLEKKIPGCQVAR